MQPIESQYKGYRFRSRLEARWAVFFDVLGIEWQYEPEGFELSDGTRYLPDFYLPKFNGGIWAEVKPENDAWDKAKRLAADSGQAVWLAYGEPGANTYEVIGGEENGHMRGCVPLASEAHRANRMYWQADHEFDREGLEGWLLYNGPHVLVAALIAKAARFEFGETPATSALRVKDSLRKIWAKHFQLKNPEIPADVWDIVLDFAEGDPA